MILLAQVHESVIFTPCCTCVVLSELFDLPFYFNLSFPVFFHSSVLTYPDLHIDLNDLDSVENNLRHSAKGSLDAYDVTHSLTQPGEEAGKLGFQSKFRLAGHVRWNPSTPGLRERWRSVERQAEESKEVFLLEK